MGKHDPHVEAKTTITADGCDARHHPTYWVQCVRGIMPGQTILHHDLISNIFAIVPSYLLKHLQGYHRNKECTVVAFLQSAAALQHTKSASLKASQEYCIV